MAQIANEGGEGASCVPEKEKGIKPPLSSHTLPRSFGRTPGSKLGRDDIRPMSTDLPQRVVLETRLQGENCSQARTEVGWGRRPSADVLRWFSNGSKQLG